MAAHGLTVGWRRARCCHYMSPARMLYVACYLMRCCVVAAECQMLGIARFLLNDVAWCMHWVYVALPMVWVARDMQPCALHLRSELRPAELHVACRLATCPLRRCALHVASPWRISMLASHWTALVAAHTQPCDAWLHCAASKGCMCCVACVAALLRFRSGRCIGSPYASARSSLCAGIRSAASLHTVHSCPPGAHTHTRALTHIPASKHTCTHTHTQATRASARTYTHTHTQTHTHTHTHTHSPFVAHSGRIRCAAVGCAGEGDSAGKPGRPSNWWDAVPTEYPSTPITPSSREAESLTEFSEYPSAPPSTVVAPIAAPDVADVGGLQVPFGHDDALVGALAAQVAMRHGRRYRLTGSDAAAGDAAAAARSAPRRPPASAGRRACACVVGIRALDSWEPALSIRGNRRSLLVGTGALDWWEPALASSGNRRSRFVGTGALDSWESGLGKCRRCVQLLRWKAGSATRASATSLPRSPTARSPRTTSGSGTRRSARTRCGRSAAWALRRTRV
jgi:hypothetical protein